MRLLLFIFIITTLCFACSKDNTSPGEKLEIYLLKSYQLVPGKCQVNDMSAILQDTAVVKNEDIIKYYKADYEFTITEKALQKIKELRDGTPFAVTVDKQVIYFGILKPSFSSSTCFNSITMDYVLSNGKITMNLGYVGSDSNIDDQRNNPKLIATLKDQQKLK